MSFFWGWRHVVLVWTDVSVFFIVTSVRTSNLTWALYCSKKLSTSQIKHFLIN
jgi:hypothetical protein